MSNICQITNKKSIVGNKRSHAMNATKCRFKINLHTHKFWIAKKNKFIKLKLSNKGMRLVNKHGIDKILKKFKKVKLYG
ncbi:50S ribosomal protein L28 [Buchnera aphidicola (Neophyllaphis varicolor)]|uniref:50S ribosomal protein L28 n=1 Tax=Buchnera aphidicola TaxID=9 RepID=UPI0031B8B00E